MKHELANLERANSDLNKKCVQMQEDWDKIHEIRSEIDQDSKNDKDESTNQYD